MKLYDKTITVNVNEAMTDAQCDKAIERLDALFEEETIEDAVSIYRKEYPTHAVEVDG